MLSISVLCIKQVKIWCTKQEASVLNIDMKANICSVKYNPGSSFYVAVCIPNLDTSCSIVPSRHKCL